MQLSLEITSRDKGFLKCIRLYKICFSWEYLKMQCTKIRICKGVSNWISLRVKARLSTMFNEVEIS